MEEVLCDFCQRSIPSDNIELHRIRCEKDRQIHITEEEKIPQNPELECEICNNMFNELEFEEHLCFCEYCDNSFQHSVIQDHMQRCGNMTEFCRNCNSFIFKRNFKLHVQVNNCSRPERPKRTRQELLAEVRRYIRQ